MNSDLIGGAGYTIHALGTTYVQHWPSIPHNDEGGAAGLCIYVCCQYTMGVD